MSTIPELTNDSWLVSEPVYDPLHVRKEVALFAENPVGTFVSAIDSGKPSPFLVDEIDRYMFAYHLYHLSLERYFEDLYYEIRWDKDLRWIRGRGRRYTPHQKKTAQKYHIHKRFVDLDFVNCLLHARIVCDRVVALSRQFLRGQKLPSFTSFNKHRDFFIAHDNPVPTHAEYAQYICENTDWFEVLKPIRDKFVVHHGPRHMRLMGFHSDNDLSLTLLVPQSPDRPHENFQMISISIRKLARDLQEFLTWFSSYGLRTLEHNHCE